MRWQIGTRFGDAITLGNEVARGSLGLARTSGRRESAGLAMRNALKRPAPRGRSTRERRWVRGLLPYAAGVGVTAVCTAVCFVLFPYVGLGDLIMIYLIGVVVISTTFGLWPSVAASALSVATLDFFFVPPYLNFVINDLKYLVTIGVMFVVGVIMGGLTDRVRREREASRLGERRMAVLYAISRDLSAEREPEALGETVRRHVSELFDCQVSLFLQGAGEASPTDADALRVPLVGSRGPVGLLCVRPNGPVPLDESERGLLETLSRVAASALERAVLAKQAEQTQVRLETERLRSGLLSSISHDLRTPLATIEGAATAILQENAKLEPEAQKELTQAIVDEARRLGRLVRNLLDLTRLESGQMRPEMEPQDVEEIIGGALTRVEARLKGRSVRTRVQEDSMPLVSMDPVLIEQALINLLENADRHTPRGGAIEISATATSTDLLVEIADAGPGLAPGTEDRIFEKFYRGSADQAGAGLGLAICRAIVTAHGGKIWAETRPEGGAIFRFSLPLGDDPFSEGPPSSPS